VRTPRLAPVLPVCLGASLFALLVWKVGARRLLGDVGAAGWGLLLPVAIGGMSHAVRTLAWRLTLPGDCRPIPFWRLMGLRLIGEAGGQFGITGQLAGESARVWLISPVVPVPRGASSVALDRGMFAIGGAILTVLGVVLALLTQPIPHALFAFFGLLAAGLTAFLGSMALALHQEWPLLSAPSRLLQRFRVTKGFAGGWQEAIRRVERTLFSFHRESPAAFWCSFALQLIAHGFAVAEVYSILWLLGKEPSVLLAFLIEALTKVVNLAGSFVPANIGTYEGGNMLILATFGLRGSTGLTLAVIRRLRALFWSALGLAYLAAFRMPSRRQRQSGE